MQIHTTQCCGLKEIWGISDFATPEEALKEIYARSISFAIYYDRVRPWWKYFIFSQALHPDLIADARHYGDNLADYIEANGLGQVSRTSPNINPNSFNSLTIYVWAMDWEACVKWHEQLT